MPMRVKTVEKWMCAALTAVMGAGACGASPSSEAEGQMGGPDAAMGQEQPGGDAMVAKMNEGGGNGADASKPTSATPDAQNDAANAEGGTEGAGDASTTGDAGTDSCPATCSATTPQDVIGWYCQEDNARLCDPVDFTAAAAADAGTQYVLTTPDAAHCALVVLRDGTKGALSYRDPGSEVTVSIRANRLGLTSSLIYFGADSQPGAMSSGPLQDPTYFDACLTQTDANALHDCFRHAVKACPNP